MAMAKHAVFTKTWQIYRPEEEVFWMPDIESNARDYNDLLKELGFKIEKINDWERDGIYFRWDINHPLLKVPLRIYFEYSHGIGPYAYRLFIQSKKEHDGSLNLFSEHQGDWLLYYFGYLFIRTKDKPIPFHKIILRMMNNEPMPEELYDRENLFKPIWNKK